MANNVDMVLTINPALGVLREHREAQGISRRQIAESLGVSIPAVQDYERNEAAGTITLKSLRKYADALDCDVELRLVPRSTTPAVAAAKVKSPRRKPATSTVLPDSGSEPASDESFAGDLGLWSAPSID